MNLLPIEPIAKELELSEMDIMKNRCELVESQIKILQKMVNDTQDENKMLKDLVQKLYFIVQEIEDGESSDEEMDTLETVAVPMEPLNVSIGSLSLKV
jgi:hypothetical protein